MLKLIGEKISTIYTENFVSLNLWFQDTILNGTKWVVKWDPPKIVDLVLVIIVRQDLTNPLQFSNVTLKGCVKGR